MKCTYSCHSPEHKAARRKFLAGMAATAAGATIGGLDFFSRPLRPRALERPEASRRLQHARRSEPARKLGPQARHRHRRPVPRDQHLGPRHPDLRAAAQCRQADAPPLPRPRRQHQGRRSRQGRLPDAHRPTANARRRISHVRVRLRQGDGAGRRARCRATSHHARRRRRSRQRRSLPRPQVREHRRSATASRRSTPRGPATLSEPMDAARNDFRRRVNERFLNRRRTAVETEAYTYSYEQALQLMAQRDVFDVSKRTGQGSRPLRQARLRPALPARPAAARTGRHVRAGHPLELRHAQRKLRLPHRTARRVRPVVRHPDRRPGRARHARQHARSS